MCAYPPLDLTHQFTLETDRASDSPGKPGGLPFAKESAQETLQRYADGVIKQYPFLDRPEYTKVVSLIVAERDRLMAQGVPAPQALQRAADAIAPQFDPEKKR
ncbi:hypothetical protein [Curvibacter lanceolatus]|uniref:hypothetical protein n=1 Tax=Curvibacter lanceolatus TaxID=86182 RepID=UPI0012F8C914|nr:hypothetical protein [Curvibacter lanceolatus]